MNRLAGPDAARWRLAAALLVLWVERLGAALWSPLALLAVLMAAALTGLFAALPVWLHLTLLAAMLGATLLLTRRGWQRLARPCLADAERRLERDSGLRHRPFAVLRDRPSASGAAGIALWDLHRARAKAAIARLRLRGPDPVLAAQDPLALRAAALLLLVAGMVIAGPQAGGRLMALFVPGLSAGRATEAPVLQAWVQPPAYTGLPPIFLPPPGAQTAPLEIPTGSRLTVSMTGITARPSLSLAGTSQRLDALGNDSFQATLTLTQGGRLRLGTWLSELGAWDLAVLPNEKPVAAWTAPPGRAGNALSTKFPWRVSQRWGVAALQAELRPAGHPDLPALTVKLGLPGTPKQATGASTVDLAENPYAGLTLTGRLLARDVSGQTGEGAPVDFVLPARIFHHPLARAIADLRRRLALHPASPDMAAADLSALAEAPFAPNDPSGLAPAAVVLNLAAASAILGETPKPGAEAVASVQARLWTLALALDGALPDRAAEELADARERLRQGLEERANGRLTQKELAQRLDALRQALAKRLADIARKAMKQGALEKFDPGTQHLSSSTMDRLIRKMEQAAREGRMDEARQRLSELEKMLDQLKSAHVMTKEEMQQQQEQARRGRQMLGAVQDLVRRETGLLDHAQARAPREVPGLQPQFHSFEFPPPVGTEEPLQEEPLPPPGLAPPGLSPPGLSPQEEPPPAPSPAPDLNRPPPAGALAQTDDARTQRALHRALDALAQHFVRSGGQKPHNLDDAAHAMDDAASALAAHDDPPARDAIGRAIAALQQGGQDMARQMSRPSNGQMQLSLQPGAGAGEEGGEEGDDEYGDGQGGRKKDPFGRQEAGNGNAADDPSLRVPDEMEQARSRAIQEELRRRGADRQRPQQELDYIGRLLKSF
jgi:uncharacterized protein (TIGR02302 family)